MRDDDREVPLTVKELIQKLSVFPPDAPVFASGEFTQAVCDAELAKVGPSNALSGYEAVYAQDAVPNAVLLT